ncbi:MAG: DUF1844 domain-containing protein [Bdellovibrionales bacterium]
MSIQSLPVTFSTLVLSLASSAVLALGLEKNPNTDQYEKDLDLARFNIDMLGLLKEKTEGNLTTEEQQFLDTVINDLKMKFVYASGGSPAGDGSQKEDKTT